MIDDRDFGKLEVRVERLETLRQRLYDYVPLAVVLVLFLFLLGKLDTMDERLDRVEAGLARIETKLNPR